MSSCYARLLTLAKPNPVMLADGSWTRDNDRIDIAVPVPFNVHKQMLEQKERDIYEYALQDEWSSLMARQSS
jgi:hypothetical protein